MLKFHVQMLVIDIEEMVRVRAPMKHGKDLYCYIDNDVSERGWRCGRACGRSCGEFINELYCANDEHPHRFNSQNIYYYA